MKYIKIFCSVLLAGLLLAACSDKSDDEGVKIDPPTNGFSFKPAPSGAIMHYTLPDNDQISGLTISYTNEYGKLVRYTGSATCDSIQLGGFNHAQENVNAKVEYIMRDQSKSAPIDVSFSTLNSAPVEFLNSAKAISNWGGFSVSFTNNAEAKGMAHVFYLGIDPLSQKADTILIDSFYLEEEDEIQYKNYQMQQDVGDDITVVVRAEDFNGNMVGEKSWSNVRQLEMEQLKWKDDFEFYCDNAVTEEASKVGVEYLFDGDKTGYSQTLEENFYPKDKMWSLLCTFLAGPNAYGEDSNPWYVDLKSNRVLANIRMYALLNWYNNSPIHYQMTYKQGNCVAPSYVSSVWETRTPCDVTIYGMKDNGKAPSSYNDMSALDGEWEEIGNFYQSPSTTYTDRYCPNVATKKYKKIIYNTYESMRAAEPEYLEISFPAAEQDEGYRYLKIVINNTFDLSATNNGVTGVENRQKYVLVQELDINTAK